MTFLILSAVSGFVLVILPIIAVGILRKRWALPKGIFIKAGIAALFVEIIHAAVLGNGSAMWPQIFDLPVYVTALILGVVGGLFTELGRFLVLDKMMKKVRDFREGVSFGFGWGGVQTVLYGIVVMLGVAGMYVIAGVSDISAMMPDADKDELAAFTEIQKQAVELMSGNAILGLSPVIERASLISIDIALSLLIIMGLFLGRTSFIWRAVGLRVLVTASIIYLNSIDILLGLAALALFGTAAFLMTRRFMDDFARLRGETRSHGQSAGHSTGVT